MIACCWPTAMVEQTRQIVVAAMESPPAGFHVPLKVDVAAGQDVGEISRRQFATVADQIATVA